MTSSSNAFPQDELVQAKSLKFKLTIFFLCIVTLIAAMDAVIVAACLVAIATDLNSTSVESFWVGTSFLLSQTVAIPIYGTSSEIFDRKWPICIAIAIFTIGSILCAIAKTVSWLIGARVVQGIGAGGMIQLVQVIVADMTTLSERALYMGFAGTAWSLGLNIGIPIGGAIGAYTSWRWVFWINIPTCIISLIGLITCLQLKQHHSSIMSKLALIDWLGLFIFTCATTIFLVGLTSGGVSYPWDSGRVLGPMIVGGLLYPVFTYVEWRVAQKPMIPLRIFKGRSAIMGFTTVYLQGLIIWCFTYYFILFFLGAMQHGILHSALETMTILAYIAPSGVVASIVVKKTRRFRYLNLIGWALLVAGLGSNVTMHPNSSKALLYAPRCLTGIGSGIIFSVPMYAVQVCQRSDDVGIATSTQVFARNLGTAFGVSLGGVIFQNRWTKLLNAMLASQDIPKDLNIPSSLAESAYGTIRQFPESVQEEYRLMYSDSMRTLWWVLFGMSIAGFFVSLTVENDEVAGGLSGTQNFVDETNGDEKTKETCQEAC